MQSFARAKVHEGKVIREQEKIIAGRCLPAHKTSLAVKQALLIMKLTAIFLCLLFMQVSARTMAQVTLAEKNAPLEKVLQSIKRQSDYAILYDQVLVQQKGKPVSINITNATVEQALAMVFKNQALTYEITPGNIILVKETKIDVINMPPVPLTPPPVDIKGKVTDETGNPVAGAAVNLKGTSRGTITNDNGEFVLEDVDEKAVLVISGVNIVTREIAVNGKSEISLVVKIKVSTLGEVTIQVNTGYEEIPKERSTGSFTHVNNAKLNLQAGTYVLDRLNGVAEGILFPTGKINTPQVIVRGISSVAGPKDPLIIVDNFPYEGNIQNINPNDVANVTILKDAAAASIWGTKAGNGVIVITTKKSAYNKKTTVEFNANIMLTQKPDLYYYPQMNSGDYVDVQQMLFNNGAYDIYDDLFPLFNYYPALQPAVETLLAERKGTISPEDAEKAMNRYRLTDIRRDYNKYFYQNGLNQQYAVNVSGGSNTINYILSLGYDYNKDVLDAAYNRTSIRFTSNYRILPKLEATVNTLFTYSKTTSGKPAYNTVLTYGTQIPYLEFADASGNPIAVAKDYRQTYTDTAGNGYLQDWNYYPLNDYKHNTTKSLAYNLFADMNLKYELMQGLNLDVKFHYEIQQSDDKNLQDKDSYGARNMINYFTQLDQSTGYTYNAIPKGSILNTTNSQLKSYNIRSQLNYSYSKANHAVYIIAGGEIKETETNINTNILYGFNEDVLTVANIDFVNPYPSYIDGGLNYITNGLSLTELNNRYVSFYANGAYTFKNKYSVSGSMRRDASNLFGVNVNDRWLPLWSAGASWNLSREKFYSWQLLPEARLRATYGYSGNADETRSAVTTFYLGSGAPFTNLPYAVVNRFGNPDLRWEKIKTINIGIDFGFKNDIVTGSIEYYIKNGTDLLGAAPLDYTAGLGSNILVTNSAATKGTGVEVSIRSKNINKGFKWETGFIFNFYRDKIVHLYKAAKEANAFIQDGTLTGNIQGKPLFSLLSYKWAGLDAATGDPQGFLDGTISKDYSAIVNNLDGLSTLDYNGPALPVYWGAVANTFSWKHLSLTANISYQLGYFYRKSSISYSDLFATGNGHADYALRWQKPGDEIKSSVPSMQYPADPYRDIFFLNSSATAYNAGNIRLQFIKLDYTIFSARSASLFKDFTIYLNAANLGIIWKATKGNVDPDYANTLPPSKTYTIGLRCHF